MKELKKIKVFSELEDKTKVISPIDNVVTEFRRYKESGEEYLCSQRSAYPIFQFNPEDFVVYTGAKDIDEVDEEFFKNSWYCKLKKNKSEWGCFHPHSVKKKMNAVLSATGRKRKNNG